MNMVKQELKIQLEQFLNRTSGLEHRFDGDMLSIKQKEDWKTLLMDLNEVQDLLLRTDKDSSEFVQVNFTDGRKILITQNLIGFKPYAVKKLDTSKVPKVVTTPDALSVFEAIDDCIRDENIDYDELNNLKRVFSSIIKGAESIGFSMKEERSWLKRLVLTEEKSAA